MRSRCTSGQRLHNGLTREEIAEVLLHVSVYAGVPAGNAAFAAAQAALAAMDESPASGER